MQPSTFITALCASTVAALPAPQATGSANSTATATATAPASSTSTGLSLTAQLFLADTAADRYTLLPDDKSFVFNFDNPAAKGKGGKGGDLVAANRKTFPALVGAGAGMAVGFLGPCGFNTPHVHPRSVELQVVTQGRLMVEMAPENGVLTADKKRRVIRNELKTNMMTPFYLGSVHAQFNPDCGNATFVAAFNNEDFGTGQVADELFALSDDVVSAAFGQAVAGEDVEKFRGAIPASIALGVEQCLVQCGISKK